MGPVPRRAAAAIATLAAAAGIAACGSGDDSGGSSSGADGDYVAEADAICVEGAREAVDAYVVSLDEAGQEAATIAYVTGLRDARTKELETLEQLTPPAEDEESFDEYLNLRRSSVDSLGGALDAAEDEDIEAFQSAESAAEQDREEADRLGAELGLGACANELSADSENEISEVVEASATSSDAELVCGLGTSRFTDQFGGLDGCVEAQADSPTAESVEIGDLRGVDEVNAVAEVELGRRGDQVDTFDVNLTYGDGEWKIETITPAS